MSTSLPVYLTFCLPNVTLQKIESRKQVESKKERRQKILLSLTEQRASDGTTAAGSENDIENNMDDGSQCFPRTAQLSTEYIDFREKIRDRGIVDSWKHYIEEDPST